MKKKGNKVTILVIITGLIILIAAFGFNALVLDGFGNGIMEIFDDVRNTVATDDEIDDVEGWGVIAKSTGGSLAGGIYIIFLIFFVVIPIIVSISSTIWCLLGRLFLIGKEEKWKYNVFRFFIIVYDVLMIIISCMFSVISNYVLLVTIPVIALVCYNFYILFIKKDQVVTEEPVQTENLNS